MRKRQSFLHTKSFSCTLISNYASDFFQVSYFSCWLLHFRLWETASSFSGATLLKNMNPEIEFLNEVLFFWFLNAKYGKLKLKKKLKYHTDSKAQNWNLRFWVLTLFLFFLFFFKLPLKKCQSCTQFHLPTKRPWKAEKAIKALVSDKLSSALVIRLETALTYFSKDHKNDH